MSEPLEFKVKNGQANPVKAKKTFLWHIMRAMIAGFMVATLAWATFSMFNAALDPLLAIFHKLS